MPRAVITGISGQDGSYLAELLLAKGYQVHGIIRPSSSTQNLDHLLKDENVHRKSLFLHVADLTDAAELREILTQVAAEELYHLAGQSHVGASFEQIEPTCEMTAMGTLRLLEIVRRLPQRPRLFHASSSEIFGRPETVPQDEGTPVSPVTPYGSAKAFATQMAAIYRHTFGLFASNGILYNHESPRRGKQFVTGKICRAAAAIKQGRQKELLLGNVSSRRDWGDAREFVVGMWLSLQHPTAEDFVFATGEVHSVQQVVEYAFTSVDLDWRDHVKQDAQLLRPNEPARLVGNAAKAQRLLGWKTHSNFERLIGEMTRSYLNDS